MRFPHDYDSRYKQHSHFRDEAHLHKPYDFAVDQQLNHHIATFKRQYWNHHSSLLRREREEFFRETSRQVAAWVHKYVGDKGCSSFFDVCPPDYIHQKDAIAKLYQAAHQRDKMPKTKNLQIISTIPEL